MGDNVEQKAARLLLDRGLRIIIADAPIWDRIRGRHKVRINPLRLGTIMEIALLRIERGLDDDTMTNLQLQTKLDAIAEIVATAVLNDARRIELEKEKLTKRLCKLPARELIKIFRHIEQINELDVFINITNYFTRQATTMTRRRMGQIRKGS